MTRAVVLEDGRIGFGPMPIKPSHVAARSGFSARRTTHTGFTLASADSPPVER